MEDIDGGLHPAVDGQSLDEDEDEVLRGSQALPTPTPSFFQLFFLFFFFIPYRKMQNTEQKYMKNAMYRTKTPLVCLIHIKWQALFNPLSARVFSTVVHAVLQSNISLSSVSPENWSVLICLFKDPFDIWHVFSTFPWLSRDKKYWYYILTFSMTMMNIFIKK